MSILLTSDLHLTDKPADSYRFELAKVLIDIGEETGSEEVFILGDLCDIKDKHKSEFVGRVIEFLSTLAESFDSVVILMGNHDYSDPEYPFFEFVNMMKFDSGGSKLYQNVSFLKETKLSDFHVKYISPDSPSSRFLFIPHTHSVEDYCKHLYQLADVMQECSAIFTHQTFAGCMADNGFTLESGVPPSIFKMQGYTGPVISGDIHVPQVMHNQITYCGSPYHVHFGDKFEPRVLVLNEDLGLEAVSTSDYFPSKLVWDIESVDELTEHPFDYKPGDQVKVRLHLSKAEMVDWENDKKAIRDFCSKEEVELFGVELKEKRSDSVHKSPNTKKSDEKQPPSAFQLTDEQVVRKFAEKENVDGDLVNVGVSIANEP